MNTIILYGMLLPLLQSSVRYIFSLFYVYLLAVHQQEDIEELNMSNYAKVKRPHSHVIPIKPGT